MLFSPLLWTFSIGASAAPLEVSSPTPGKAGRDNVVTVTGAAPGDLVRLFVGRDTGTTAVGPCPGQFLSLDQPRLAGTERADAAGEAHFTLSVPADLAGAASWYQAIQPTTCDLSTAVGWVFPRPLDVLVESADVVLFGEHTDENAGGSLAVGDFDGDGLDDLAIGAPTRDAPRWGGGAVYVQRGLVGGARGLDGADARLFGQQGESAGRALATGCDLDGSGTADLLIGATTEDFGERSGVIYLMRGAVSGDHDLADAPARIVGGSGSGASTARCADHSGDGVVDLIVGAPRYAGGAPDGGAVVWLDGPFGPGDRHLSTARARLVGDLERGSVGERLAIADLDGDGEVDVAASSDPYHTGIGAYLVYGPVVGDLPTSAADARLEAETPADAAGFALAAGGDIDGDGLPDLLVGAPDGGPYGTGVGYVVAGAPVGDTSLADAHTRVFGEVPGDAAGAAMTTADFDQDGHDDLVVSATGVDGGGDWAGRVYLLYGPMAGDIELAAADRRFLTQGVMSWAGYRLATGDFDGDALPDLVVSAPWDSAGNGFEPRGAVFVTLGSSL